MNEVVDVLALSLSAPGSSGMRAAISEATSSRSAGATLRRDSPAALAANWLQDGDSVVL